MIKQRGTESWASERELAPERLSCSNCVVRPHRSSGVA